MICQYCGHKLTDGKCLNPACPGRLIVHKFSLPDGKLVEIADERVWIYGSFDYLTTDEIDVIHAEIHRNDPDIAEAREKEDREMYEQPAPPSREERIEKAAKKILGLRKDCLYCEDHGLCEAEISIVLTELMEGKP